MKHRLIGIITLILVLSVLLALPIASQAYDDGTICRNSNTGKHAFEVYKSQDATCEQEGYIDWICSLCKARAHQVTRAALGHNFQFVVRDQPTCTTPGYGIDTCTRCGANRDNGRRIDPLGHNYQRSVAQEATCTKDGMAVYTCSRCGDSYREPIPATGHKWGAWVDGDPATCVQYGTRYHQCTRCGQKEWERNYAGGLGDHDWGEWVTVKEPTATEPGLQERTCKVDANHKEQQEIPAIGEPEADPATNEPAEEAKPALKLGVGQYPEQEVYQIGDEVVYDRLLTNTGNVALRYKFAFIIGKTNEDYADYYEFGKIFSGVIYPGEELQVLAAHGMFYHRFEEENMIPDPEDSPYAGTDRVTWKVYGYAVDDTEFTTPICESNAYTFECKIAKPGPEPWPIPEESQLEVEVYSWLSTSIPSDPAGYQLGETWNTRVYMMNHGTEPVDIVKYRVDYCAVPYDWFYTTSMPEAITDGATWYEWDISAYAEPLVPYHEGNFYDGQQWPGIWGMITPEDVERGYIQVRATVTWIDPLSGAERKSYSNVWHMPVISKTGLVLNKGYKDPANGEYFEEGEQIEWTLSMKNNSKEPIKDITITDKGALIGMFAEFTPEQGEIKLGVPKYTVTEYDAKVVGKVTNIANATGTDLKGVEHTYPSNPAVAKAGNKAPDPNDGDGGGGTDPLGPIYGYDIAVSIIKAEAHGPAQEDWYALNENVDYTVTVKNTGKDPIENVTVYDSLNGFAPIGTVGSLAPGEEKTFSFTWKVTQYNVDVMHYVVNQATVTYTFGGGISGTPMKSNKVYVKAGENGFIPEDGLIDPDGDPDGHFDPGLLHGEGDDCCAMTLLHTRDNEADYQLTLCGEHAKVIADAKTAADAGDWKTAAETIRTALDEIYTKYYEAGDDSAKAAVMNERLTYYAHIGAYQTLAGDKAAAEKMALKLIQMCSMANTAPETLPDSLANGMNGILGDNPDVTATGRVIGLFDGKNEVTDTYAGADARALKNVKDLLKAAKSYNYDEVFERGQIIWQTALDESVNAIYKAADRETRKQIAAWRISLDNLYTGERPMLEMLYPDNDAAIEEILMNLYRDTALDKEQVR